MNQTRHSQPAIAQLQAQLNHLEAALTEGRMADARQVVSRVERTANELWYRLLRAEQDLDT